MRPSHRISWLAAAFLLGLPCVGSTSTTNTSLAHLDRAWAYAIRGDWKPAAREAEAAVALLRSSGRGKLPEALELFGTAELKLGRPAQAADHFREALAICKGCTERSRLLRCLAAAFRDLRRFSEAEAILRELLAKAERAGSIEEQGLIFEGLASLALAQNRRTEAVPLFREVLRRQPPETRTANRADLFGVLGVLLYETGDSLGALESLRQSEGLRIGLGDLSGLLMVRNNIARAYLQLGRYDAAFSLFQEVETAARQRGDQNELSRSLTGSAVALETKGRTEEAEKRLKQALSIERARKNRGGMAEVLSFLARLDLKSGRYDLALSRFEQAAALAHTGEAGDSQSELTSMLDGFSVFRSFNRIDEASSRLLHASELTANGSLQSNLLDAMFLSIAPLFAAHRFDETLRQIDRTLALTRQLGARPAELTVLKIRATHLIFLHRMAESQKDAEAALALSRELGDRQEEAAVSYLLGFNLLHERRYDEARSYLERSLRFEREAGSAGPRAATLWSLATAYEKQGNSTEAIAAYREAVEITESGFSEVRAEDLFLGLAQGAFGSYGRWANLLAQKGEATQAFAVSERARARMFLRRMGNPPPDLRKAVNPALLQEEDALHRKIEDLTRELRERQRQMSFTPDESSAELGRKLDGARRDFDTLRIRIQQANPAYASLVLPSPLTVPEIQELLDDETTLVEYLLLDDTSWAWVIEKNSVDLVRLSLDDGDVSQKVEELRQRIATREPIGAQASSLYMALFDWVEPHIHHKNLFVVPHGALHALPFGALTPDSGKTWLVEKYALSVLPSASVLPFILAPRNGKAGKVLALGDPDGTLPSAASETRAIASLYGTKALIGPEASTAALRSAPRPIGILHLAAHAIFDPIRPLFSRIRLADGELSAHDILNLDLHGTRLVVLSGCETAVGPSDVGELEGLSRAFLYAGASTIAATLWKVDDEASRALMLAFYRHLRAGTPTAEALRLAQVEILHGREEWRHPYYWAAFQITGDPG